MNDIESLIGLVAAISIPIGAIRYVWTKYDTMKTTLKELTDVFNVIIAAIEDDNITEAEIYAIAKESKEFFDAAAELVKK